MRTLFAFFILAAWSLTAGDLELSAHADQYTTPWDAVLTVNAPGVLANDNASEGDQLVVTLAQAPAVGAVTLREDGSFSYTPAANSEGPVTFVYAVENQNGELSHAAVTIDVTAGNKAPLGIDNYYTVQVPNSLSVSAANGVLANDLDLDGDVLSAELVEAPAVGALPLNTDGSFTYEVDPADSGRYQFRYRVVDTRGASAEATAFLTLISPNVPVAVPDRGDVLWGREGYINVLANDYDPDGNALRVVSVSGGDSQFIRVVDDQTIAYFTWSGGPRVVMLNYTITDGIHEVSSTVAVNILDTRVPPVVVNDYFELAPGESVTFNPITNDHDINGLPLIFHFYGPRDGYQFGTMVREGNTETETDRFTYTAGSEPGTEVMHYAVWNGYRDAPGQVTIVVNPANTAPVVANEAVVLPLDDSLYELDVLANDFDPDNDNLTIARVAVQGGTEGVSVVTGDENRSLSMQAMRPGVFVIDYWVSDGIDETPGHMEITITEADDATSSKK